MRECDIIRQELGTIGRKIPSEIYAVNAMNILLDGMEMREAMRNKSVDVLKVMDAVRDHSKDSNAECSTDSVQIAKLGPGEPENVKPLRPTPPMQQTTRTSLTTDPNDPRLTHGADDQPVEQNEVYLVLSDEERAKGFVRPVRRAYKHTFCGKVTTMGQELCETYARDPKFYDYTYCCACRKHLPVAGFTWVEDGKEVGS